MRPILLVAVLSAGCASAQVPRDRAEKASDRKALRVDARERRDDTRDALSLENLLARYDAARAHHDFSGLSVLDRELKSKVERELAESRSELSNDAKEVRQDRREVARDRRELQPARDDRQDLRDDRRDALVEAGGLVRVKAINVELNGLLGKTDPASFDRKRELLVELIRLGWSELGQDRREAREDHRELREDRRELHEDVKR